MLVLELTKP
ncbi:hypothetical protein F383_02616 [Gossypium arboreum]|uniref:Uncharacterized protein n=1 Tax=Gossypium arboreum TaxID=29729 RepID=A0A0B0P5N5_GOSAR|nr:hypothetical protein F383_02616 [Gossypium arboreum]